MLAGITESTGFLWFFLSWRCQQAQKKEIKDYSADRGILSLCLTEERELTRIVLKLLGSTFVLYLHIFLWNQFLHP
jgi:hypothetical protein